MREFEIALLCYEEILTSSQNNFSTCQNDIVIIQAILS